MSAPNTYTRLRNTIITVCEDQTAEFLAYIPIAINTAESRLFRLMDINWTTSIQLTTFAGSPTLNKPSAHRATRHLYINTDGNRQRLIKKTRDYVRDYWPSTTELGIPKYYADDTETVWLLAPTPNGSYIVEISYEALPTPLSTTNETNIISQKYPDLLFYAAMSNMCEWMKDVERKAEWEEKLREALASVNREGERNRMDDNTHVFNPEGGLNTKVKGSP